MATTEADISEPTREEERKMVDQAAEKVTKEEKTSTDNKPNEPPKTLESNFDVKDVEKSNEGSASTIESENFLKSPLIAEVSFEAKNLSLDACKVTEKPEKTMKDDTDISPLGNAKLDDQPLEITASEEIILEGIEENAEESNGKYGEKSMTSVPSTVDSAGSTLGTKAGDIIYDPDQEDIKVEIQMSKETSTEDDGTTNSFTTETGPPEENLCQTSLQSKESKGSEIPNISEVKNLNPEVKMPNDESGRMKTTKDEIPCILVADMPTEGESPSDQNEAVNGNSEKNAEEVAGSVLKSKTTDEMSSENAVEEEMSYDGSKTTGLPILLERANEEIKERKNGDNAKNLSCSPLVTTEIEEISSEQVGLGNELHNNAEKASQEKILDRETMTAVIAHEYELQGENESESSFLKEKDDIRIQKGDKTVTIPEYSDTIVQIAGKKSQEEVENQSKMLEENITIHTNPTGTEETEENALIQDEGSQMKYEAHLEKENEKPRFIDASMRNTSDDESTAKNADEELRKAQLSEKKKDKESTLVVSATTEKYTESLKVAPEDVEPSISFQDTETRSSLEEKNQTANLQEILCNEIEQPSDVVDRKEETLKNNLTLVPNEETEENSAIEVDGSQIKGEEHLDKENKMTCITEALATDTSDNKSTLMLEVKMKDVDLRKDELIKYQTGSESAMLKQEATMQKPIDSLQVAPEDIKASTSDQDTKTSSLEKQNLTENPQEILDDKTESKICGVVDEKEETLEVQAVPKIKLNDDNEDNSVIKEYESEMKYEESLEKEYEKPSVKEDSTRDAIDDNSTYMQEDEFEDKDLRKAEIFENKKDTENTLLKEETTVMKPIESLQLDPEDIRTYASDHGTETTITNASSCDGIAEDITLDAADMKEETVENVTTIVSNEDIEEKPTIKMDSSQIKQEEYLEREGQIPLTIEALTGKTGDDESIISHVDNTEHEDLRKAELLESEKHIESSLLNKETQMQITIKSLQVVAEDIIALTSSQDTETSSHQERKLYAHENLGQQIEDKTINAADTKEKTPEAQNVPTIFSNENSKEEKSLIQMDELNIKHEELSEKEGKMFSSSEILVVETNNEESKIIHEDKVAESTLLKEELQVDKPIESLKVGFEDNEASVSCQDQEATSSFMDQSITANPNAIMDEPTEEKTTDSGDTKEKTPEVQQNFTTIVANENAEKNSLIQVDASQEKHEDLFENEREMPAISETLTAETNNQEPTFIQEDKIQDKDSQKIDVYKQEESTSLKEEAQLDKPIESLQAAPGDNKTLASCQDTETMSFLLTENPQEIGGEQIEGKIVDAAGTKEKNSKTHNFKTTVSNENNEENSLLQMDGSKIKHEELLYKESEMPSLSETLEVNTNDEESKIIHEDNNAGSTLFKEEVQVGRPIESLQVALEEIEASVSCQDPETRSFLKERSLTENLHEIVGGQTEDKIIDTDDINEKNSETTPEAQNFPPIFSINNAENNSLIQMDASQRKHEELFEKEREIPALSETLTAETNNKESIIIHEEKIEDENIKKVAEYESEKHVENTFLNKEAMVDTPIESLNIAPDGKASASCQETETSSLEERSLTANSQEIEGNQTEHKIIDETNTKEKSLELQDFATILTNENSEENSLLQMDGPQMKHEILLEKESEIPSLSETSVVEANNQESIITHAECTLSKEERHIGNPIKSLQEAPEDNKASCQHVETTSSLEEQSLIANTQFGDQIENQVSAGPDTKEETPEAQLQGLATVVSNEKTKEISLEKEREIPSLSEASIVDTNNEESTVMHDLFQSKKHPESILLKEVQVDQSVESLQVPLKETEASFSCQDPETTNSLAEQSTTANPQEILDGQTEDKIIDTARIKDKTTEALNSPTSVSNENAEKKKLIQLDASEKKHEELFKNEREIPALSEASTVETNNHESTVIHVDKIEDEDLQKVDEYEQAESALWKEEAQLDKPIGSLQAAPGDSKASASCNDTETSFLEEESLTENPQEIKGDRTVDKIIDAADAKEKTTETHNFATTVTNENIEENSLLQMDGSQIKHEELLTKETEIQSLSETLAVKTNNEESKLIHEDKDEGSTLFKEDLQVDQHIESLHVALDENETSVSYQDPETTCSLEEQTLTENTQEIVGGQTEDKIIDTAETKEKTFEAQNSTTIISNDNTEELFKNEREIPSLSETLTVETDNQESMVIQEDKIEDVDLQKVDVYEQEESTFLKEESQLHKPIESLQTAPGDSKASASCQGTETSFLEEGSLTESPKEIKGDRTEDKIIGAADAKEKTTETHLQNFATIVTNENVEQNSLLQMDGSKIKHEELLDKETEIPSSSETLAVNTNNEDSKIIQEDNVAGSSLSKEEVQADQHIESLQVAFEENEASVSCQDPETTCSLEEQRLTENTQELVGDQAEDKIIDTANIKEKTPETHNSTTIVSNENAGKNSLIQVHASQKKHEELVDNDKEIPVLSETLTAETNNEESIIIHEDKIEDQEVKKADKCESEEQRESTFLHEEAQAGKRIESLHASPEDCKVSHQDTETSSFLEERSLTENPQEIVGDQIEEKITDAANTNEKTPYTNDFVTNDKIDDGSVLQMDGSQLKHEELLEKKGGVPSSSNTLAEEANNEESTIIHNDKFEDEDVKTVDVFEEKHAICTLSMEQSRVDEPFKSLQVAPEDIKASCQHLEKASSPKEQSLIAYPQFANQTEDKIYDTPDTKEKTSEAQGFTVVSNENIEENARIQVDESQIKHEVLETKREMPSLSETLTVETNNEETTIIHEDKIEVEDLKNDDIFESEKYAESNLLKEEAWVQQVASEDIKASVLCQDRETIISLEDQSPTVNPQEIVGDQAQAETIDAADTKEKPPEVQVRTILDPTTIISNENAEKNSLIQLGASQKKHEEKTENETPTLSDTLMVESDNEKSTIIHEDNIENKDLKEENGYKNSKAQVDTPIESLEGVPEDIKASPSCLDTETTSSLEEQSLTANPQEIVGDQTEDTIIDAADTKEESLEARDFTTNETNGKTEDNSLLKMDGSQLKHEELLENESEMPSLSETLEQDANNEESTILHKDKFEDEDLKTVDAFENEKFIESTLLKEEMKVGKHVESMQITPEDIKASASCQDRDTTSTLVEQSLIANAQETVCEQTEDKIIATADTKDKAPVTLKNGTKIISNEDNESAIPCCKSSYLDATDQLKEEELNDSNIIQEMKVPEGDYIPPLDENMIEKMDSKESEAAEDATNYKHTENLQHEDTTESIMDDLKHLEPTEKDKEEAKCKVTLNQTMEKTKESTLAVKDHSATERELTIGKEEMHMGKTAKDGDEAAKIDKDDEEEEKGKKNISDFSSEASITIEARDEEVARLVYEEADQKITTGVAEESNILNGVTETGDRKVLKREMTQEDTLDTVKSIEGLEIISHDKDPEILMTNSKVIEGQEVGNSSYSETSVLVSQSEKANLDDAQIGSVTEEKFKSNEIDFPDKESTSVCESIDQGVKELKSFEITTIGNNSEKNDKEINRDDGKGYETKNESVEEETQDDINYVPEKQELQDSVSLSKELPLKTSSKMEKITYDGEANEDSVELGEEETLKHVGNLNYNASTKDDNDTVNSISESSETVEPENMEVATETVAQLQNCELISKVEDLYTKEDKLEEAASEIKSDKIVAEDILDPKETMKVYFSTDKVKEETESAKNYHIGSCKEEIVLDNYQEDEVKPEDDSRINTEEIFGAIKDADENKKVSEVLGEANATDNINERIVLDDKAVEEPDEIIQANEPKDGSLHQQEKEKSVNQVTTGLDTKEKEHDLHYLIQKTSIEDPREEVNSSILVLQEEEDNRIGANGINNIMTKDAELLTMNNKNANTTMMELQEHRESKHGSLPLSEVLQVQGSEKQDKKDETFSSDKVQGKDEMSLPQEKETISASKSGMEADRVDNLRRTTEDENNKNIIEVELTEHDSKAKAVTAESGTDSVDVTETGESGQKENASDDCEGMAEPSTSMVSTEIMQEHATGDQENQDQLTKLHEFPLLSHVKDSEVGMAQKQGPVDLQSGSGTTDNVQDLNEFCFTVSNMGNLQGENSNENVEVKVSSGEKEADIIQRDLVSNTVKQEIAEQQLPNTVEAVSEERGMNSEEDKIKDASCNDSQENSSSVDTDKVAPSNILQGSIGDEAQGTNSQETERQHSSLPFLPHTKCSDMEIAQKDIPLHFAKKDEDDQKELEAAPLPTTDKPIVLEADHNDNTSSNISMLQHGDSLGSSLTKGEKQEPSKFEKEEEKCGREETTKPMKTEQSTEIDKPSLSHLLQLSGKETLQNADHFTVKLNIQKEDLHEEKSNEAAHEEARTDEEKDDEGELSEHKSSDMSSEAPVMVDVGDADVKVAHKKSHNILSGVGSKVKHSIAKVKKAITGKSSHPKSRSPKYDEKI